MSPLGISAYIAAVFMAAGTVVCGVALLLGALMAREKMPPSKAFLHGFSLAMLSGSIYSLVLRFVDNTQQPLINAGFFISVGAAVGASYFGVMKVCEGEVKKVPLMWMPVGAVVVVLLFATRTQGAAFKEKEGYYRGYERFAYLNMSDTPGAMADPEKAVQYYVEQFKALKNANPDTGLGKIMTTATHEDVKWFIDNFQFIMENQKKSDMTGITTVVQSPNDHKFMALLVVCKPLFGQPAKTWTEGKEAAVQMSSGQLVHLSKEGRNWKVRNWLGMRPWVTHEIYEVKSKNGSTTPEDDKFKDGIQAYEEEMKTLCSKAGLQYMEFDPYFDEEEEEAGQQPGMSLLSSNKPRKRKSTTGFAKLDQAKTGELVDLEQTPAPGTASAPATPAAPAEATPPAPAAAQPTPIQLAAAALQDPGAAPAAVPPGEEPSAQPSPAASDADSGKPTLLGVQAARDAVSATNASTAAQMPDQAPPAAAPTAAAPAAPTPPPAAPTPANPNASPAPVTPTPTPLILANIPVSTLWKQYFDAVRLLDAGDVSGVVAFQNVMSADDNQWFETNYRAIAELISPGTVHPSHMNMKLIALQAMLRSMPHSPGPSEPAMITKSGSGVAVAEVVENGAMGAVKYRTILVQESGRWVLAHLFFARDFVWVPQLALYKAFKRLPLSQDEQMFLSQGFAPFQKQVQMVFASLGYGG